MTQIPIDCPHCATRNVATTIRVIAPAEPMRTSVFVTCNKCKMGVTLYCISPPLPDRVLAGDRLDVTREDGKKLADLLTVIRMSPAFPAPRAILHVPEAVERAYREGEANRAEKRYLSAAGNYRTALDRALKLIVTDEKGTIYAKVEKLAAQNAIPQALIGLMHEIRFLGNQIHDMDDPDPADVEAGAEFSTLLLTYLFELPGRVADAAAKRTAISATQS